jgi:hypothetical protein
MPPRSAATALIASCLALAGCSPSHPPASLSQPTTAPLAEPAAARATPPEPTPPESPLPLLPETAATPSPSFHDFLPSRDGFAFVNAFSGSPLPTPLGPAERRLGLPSRFGLCGGMSTAAADFFLAHRPIPTSAAQPTRGTPLYDYLYTRQAASLGVLGAGGARFLEWMTLPDDGPDGTLARSLRNLPDILQNLDGGRPVILGLVLVSRDAPRGARREPWENHQVLAYRATRLPLGVVELRVYDPNFPGRDDAIVRILQTPAEEGAGRVSISRLVPGVPPLRIRGLFELPYIPAIPPPGL